MCLSCRHCRLFCKFSDVSLLISSVKQCEGVGRDKSFGGRTETVQCLSLLCRWFCCRGRRESSGHPTWSIPVHSTCWNQSWPSLQPWALPGIKWARLLPPELSELSQCQLRGCVTAIPRAGTGQIPKSRQMFRRTLGVFPWVTQLCCLHL